MRKQQGLTLLETLLVFAIIAAIFVIGFRVYRQYSQRAYGEELQANVETLFQAMAHYYQANCRRGTLSPSQMAYPPSGPFPLDVDMLLTQGFLKKNLPMNPLVNRTNSYLIQFNPVLPGGTRSVTTNFYALDHGNPQGPSAPKEIVKKNSIFFWRIQVAVRMVDTKNIDLYRGLLGATCASSLEGTSVTPCNNNPSPKDYLVWERLPSFASPAATSSLWPSLGRVQQFNQEYTNDDFYALNYDDSEWNKSSNYEYYLCGG